MRLVGVLVLVVFAIGVSAVGSFSAIFGPDHWLCGVVGFGLSLIPAALTLWLAQWLGRRSPYGVLIGMAVGPLVRLPAVLLVAAGVFFAAQRDPSRWQDLGHPLRFWLWVLAGYVVSLIVETVLLVRMAPPYVRREPGLGG